MPCQGIGLSLEGSGEPPANGVWAGREKIRSVFILLTWLQHGRGATVYGCRETWEDPRDHGPGARGLVWMSRNVFMEQLSKKVLVGASLQPGMTGLPSLVEWEACLAAIQRPELSPPKAG